MKLNTLRLPLILALLFSLFSSPAYAHPPYIVKEKDIIGPNNENLIVEKLYGDGIFGSDPVAFQIRNSNGAVIASSIVSDNIAYFCPSISNCWIFPNGFLPFFSKGYKLNSENLEYSKKLSDKNNFQEDRVKFEDYLQGREKTLQSNSLPYPESNDEEPYGFSDVPLSYIASPFVMIFDKAFHYAFVVLLIYAQIKICKKISRSLYQIENKPKVSPLLSILAYLLITSFLVVDLFIVLIMALSFAVPISYLIAFIGLGIFLANKKPASKQEADFLERT